jgi:hypothetical protein
MLTMADPERVTIGAVVSCTTTVRIAPELFPATSTFLYSIIYVPSAPVFTVPLRVNDPTAPYVPVNADPLPSTLSVHEAPSSA